LDGTYNPRTNHSRTGIPSVDGHTVSRLCELKLCCLEAWGGNVWKYVERWEKLQSTKPESEREDYFTAWNNRRSEYITCVEHCCEGWNGGEVGIGYWGRLPADWMGRTIYLECGLARFVMENQFPSWHSLKSGEPATWSNYEFVPLSPPPPNCWTRFDDECCYLDDGHPGCSSLARKARQELHQTCTQRLDDKLRVDWLQQQRHTGLSFCHSRFCPERGWY
jgi:hypothetical protein